MREPEDWDKQEYRIPRLFILNKGIAESGDSTGAKNCFAYAKDKTTLSYLLPLHGGSGDG